MRGRSPPRPLLAVPNVTAHPSAASVSITVLQYNDPLLCSFNVPMKWLMQSVVLLLLVYDRAYDYVYDWFMHDQRHYVFVAVCS